MKSLTILQLAILTLFCLSVPLTHVIGAGFVSTSGKSLLYNGTTIILRGANFNNVKALGANIGSNNINDIPETDTDYQTLASYGANHARFGLSYSWYTANRTQFFTKIDQQVQWAHQYGIWISLVLFTIPSGTTDCYEGYGNTCPIWSNTTYQQQLQDFWVDVATHYQNEPAIVGYDLQNEPTPPGPGWCSTWLPLAQKYKNAVTAVDPNHLVFIEACSDGGFAHTFTKADGTTKAADVIYETHYYDPMSMTSPGYNPAASTLPTYPGNAQVWVGGVQKTLYFDKTTYDGTRYPGQYSLPDKTSVNWANQNNVPIYIGEWGAQGWITGYAQLIADQATVITDNKINHAYFVWRQDPTGSGWRWGLFNTTGPLVVSDQAKLTAAKISFANSYQPNFGNTTTVAPPTPSTTLGASATPVTPSNGASPTLAAKPGDVNNDGKVDIFDYNIIVGNFGKTGTNVADINGDGKVDIFDYNLLVGNFGK